MIFMSSMAGMHTSPVAVHMRDAVARSLVTHHHALPQKDFLKADVFVVKSLTSPGQRVEWMAKLGGLAIVSSDYANGEQNGPMDQIQRHCQDPARSPPPFGQALSRKASVLNGHFEAAVREAKVYVANHSGPN